MLDTEMELAMRFDAQTTAAPTAWTTCAYCGRIHATTCPRITAIEYHECGTVKRVELREPEPNVVPFPVPVSPLTTWPSPRSWENGPTCTSVASNVAPADDLRIYDPDGD